MLPVENRDARWETLAGAARNCSSVGSWILTALLSRCSARHPPFDLDALSTAVQEAGAQAERARGVAERRGAIVANLHQTANRLDGESEVIDKLRGES